MSSYKEFADGGYIYQWSPAEDDIPLAMYHGSNYMGGPPHYDPYGGPPLSAIQEETPWPHSVKVTEVHPMMSPYGGMDLLYTDQGSIYVNKLPHLRGHLADGQIVLEWICTKTCCYSFLKWATLNKIDHVHFSSPTITPFSEVPPTPTDWESKREILARQLKTSSPAIIEEVKRLLQEAADVLIVDGWVKGTAHSKRERRNFTDDPIF